MNLRQLTIRTAVLALALCAAVHGVAESAKADTKADHPNVLWILLDALRAQELGCYGYERPTTPNLDKLAAGGALCEQNVTQGFNTVDSVPSFMTGRYFASPCIGQLPWEWATRTPAPDEELVPVTLKNAGYQTWLVTSHLWITPETPLWKAFDTPVFVPAPTREMVQAPFELLRAEALNLVDSRDKGKPFFLYLHALDTHFPHLPRPDFKQWLPDGIDKATSPYDDVEREYLRGLYDGDLAYTDAQIALLLTGLKERGLLDKTIIVISADHGEILGEDGKTADHRRFVSREMMLTPLIISGPGVPKGVRTKELTENVDIVPTLLDLAGVSSSAKHDGKSVLPLFAKDAAPLKPYTFTWKRGLDGQKTFVFLTKDWAYEGDSGHFWKTLPALAQAKDQLLPEPSKEITEAVAKYSAERGVALDAFVARPTDRPAVFYMPVPATATPKDAYVTFEERKGDDNKWDLMEGLARTWPTESTPPLTLEFPVPNGTYDLQMEINTTKLPTGGPHCVIAFKVEDAQTWQVVSSPILQEFPGYAYVNIGRHEIKDGKFTVTVRQALPGVAAASIRKFKFMPKELATDSGGASAEEQSAVDEKLRALGYLN